MRKILFAVLIIAFSSTNSFAKEKRCGWFQNPTPANAWLIDRDGEWIVSYQGGHQAQGDWPVFADHQWVKTNIHYGYGCACLTVDVNRRTKYIKKIYSAKALDLSVCKRDKSIKSPVN